MSGDEIAALSLADVGEKIAKKEISSLEATEAAATTHAGRSA